MIIEILFQTVGYIAFGTALLFLVLVVGCMLTSQGETFPTHLLDVRPTPTPLDSRMRKISDDLRDSMLFSDIESFRSDFNTPTSKVTS